jgi:hypothetical protein
LVPKQKASSRAEIRTTVAETFPTERAHELGQQAVIGTQR